MSVFLKPQYLVSYKKNLYFSCAHDFAQIRKEILKYSQMITKYIYSVAQEETVFRVNIFRVQCLP